MEFHLHNMNMQNRIKIIHDNEEILVRQDSSLNQLLQSKKLIELSMQEWYNLFMMKDYQVSEDVLLEVLKQKIINYDKSKEINTFTLKGIDYWFNKETRVSLFYLTNSIDTNVEFVLGDKIVNLSKEDALKFLSELEVYAQKCYLITHKHLNNINNLKTVDEIINYKYNNEYPDKINFN